MPIDAEAVSEEVIVCCVLKELEPVEETVVEYVGVPKLVLELVGGFDNVSIDD